MVAWYVPHAVAKKLALRGGEKPEDMHLTLAFLPDMETVALDEVMDCLRAASKKYGPLKGTISSVGRFSASESSDGKDVIYAGVDVPGLAALRTELFDCLKKSASPSEDHDFTPHITLKYVAPSAATPVKRLPPLDIKIDHLVLASADKRVLEVQLGSKHTMLYGLEHNQDHLDELGRSYLPKIYTWKAASRDRAGLFEAQRLKDEATLGDAMERFLRWLGNRVAARLNDLRPEAAKAIHYIREALPLAEIWHETRAKQYEQLVLDQDFWDAAQAQFAGTASPLATDVMLRGALEAEQLLPLVNFELANATVYLLAGQYVNSWWDALANTTRNQLRDAIQAHIASGAPHSSLIKTLSPLFGRQRADVIATTEVTRMYAEGNSIGYQTAGINTVEWVTVSDELVCPICEPLDGERFPIGGTKPPAHVRCRCWLSPVSASA